MGFDIERTAEEILNTPNSAETDVLPTWSAANNPEEELIKQEILTRVLEIANSTNPELQKSLFENTNLTDAEYLLDITKYRSLCSIDLWNILESPIGAGNDILLLKIESLFAKYGDAKFVLDPNDEKRLFALYSELKIYDDEKNVDIPDDKREFAKEQSKRIEGALYNTNKRLVRLVMRQLHFNDDEYFGYGSIGLLRAIRGFKPETGIRFSTYASYAIKNSILRALDTNYQTGIHTNRCTMQKYRKLKETAQRLYPGVEMNQLSLEQIAHAKAVTSWKDDLGVSVKTARMISELPKHLVELDRPIDGDDGDGGRTIGETIASTNNTADEAETNVKYQQTKQLLEKVVNVLLEYKSLEPREAEIFILHYVQGMSAEEIAKMIGWKPSSVNQSIGTARRKIRQYLDPRDFI